VLVNVWSAKFQDPLSPARQKNFALAAAGSAALGGFGRPLALIHVKLTE